MVACSPPSFPYGFSMIGELKPGVELAAMTVDGGGVLLALQEASHCAVNGGDSWRRRAARSHSGMEYPPLPTPACHSPPPPPPLGLPAPQEIAVTVSL